MLSTSFLCNSDGSEEMSPSELLKTDMGGKVITHMILPTMVKHTSFKLYKVAKRIQVWVGK